MCSLLPSCTVGVRTRRVSPRAALITALLSLAAAMPAFSQGQPEPAIIRRLEPVTSQPAPPPASAPVTITELPVTGSLQPVTTTTEQEPFWVRVTGDNVNVRSSADQNSIAVAQVNRGQTLRAVGETGGWLRVLPMPGTFSLVSAEFVTRADGNRGAVRVTEGTLRARVGSTLVEVDPLTSPPHAWLDDGTTVQILGEQGSWYKIVPPEGVFFYIANEFVERVAPDEAARLTAAEPSSATERIGLVPVAPASSEPIADRGASSGLPSTGTLPPVAASQGETSRPAEPVVSGDARAEEPKIPDLPDTLWGRRLRQTLEAVHSEGDRNVLEQQWEPLLPPLQSIAGQRDEPAVAEEARNTLERIEDLRRTQSEMRRARGLSDPYTGTPSKMKLFEFDAVGVLRPSIRVPASESGLRYELQDPFSRKALAIVEFPPNLGLSVPRLVGKYVGVRGQKFTITSPTATIIRVDNYTVLAPEQPETPRETP